MVLSQVGIEQSTYLFSTRLRCTPTVVVIMHFSHQFTLSLRPVLHHDLARSNPSLILISFVMASFSLRPSQSGFALLYVVSLNAAERMQ